MEFVDETGMPATSNLPPIVEQWNPEHVQSFFKANKKEYHLTETHIATLYNEEVSGRNLLDLTSEQLQSRPFNFRFGPAGTYHYENMIWASRV